MLRADPGLDVGGAERLLEQGLIPHLTMRWMWCNILTASSNTTENQEVIVRVTTKGQVTIPLEIRERLNIQPGSEVEFEIEGDVIKLAPVKRASRGKRIVAHLRGRATVRMSTDEIMALTRGE
jgi:antitoxin PrlF